VLHGAADARDPGRLLGLHRIMLELEGYAALLFDLDGVVTDTATLHAAAWKQLFDEFLEQRALERGEPFVEFDADGDYRAHVDGRRRYDGVDTFLRSRGIELPWGDPSDGPDAPTVCGLGNRKDGYFMAALRERPIDIYEDAVALIRAARDRGQRIAVVTSSEHGEHVLRAAGLWELFDVAVTGVEAAALGLAGKPAPDTFVAAAGQLGVEVPRAVVFEDAVSGVEAGRAGGFGLVVGVDRRGGGSALAEHGADIVVSHL
jgi:trehalose 6-phosphate phosphatase